MRKITNYHTYKAFVPKKESLLAERLQHLKANNMQGYAKCISLHQQTYRKYIGLFSKLAADHLRMDEQNFTASEKEAMKVPAIAKAINEDEDLVRIRVEGKKEILFSKDEMKAIVLEKLKLESAAARKLALMQSKNSQEALCFFMIEQTKVLDLIFMKHKLRTVELLQAVREYDLENDPDVKALTAANAKEKENIQKAKLNQQ